MLMFRLSCIEWSCFCLCLVKIIVFFCLTTSCGLVWCWCSVRLFMSNRRTPWQRCEPQASSQWSWGLLVRVRPVSWGQRLLFSSLDSGINHFSFFREGVNSIPAIKSQLWWFNSQTAKILTSLYIQQDTVYIYIYIYIYRNKGLKFN